MSSPGQKRGSCGHAMAIFDGHAFCARCREKGKGEEPCIANKDTVDCTLCNAFTPEQRAQISTPSYKIKKEKREAKRLDSTQPTDDFVDPSSVSVIGVVSGPSADKSPIPPKKKPKKDKPSTKTKKSSSALSSATEDKFTALEDKWSDRFNRLEALLLARSMEPTFSSDVRVAPAHPPPAIVARDAEPFFQPTDRPMDSSQRTGPDSSAALQPSAGKLPKDSPLYGSSSPEHTGPDNIALDWLCQNLSKLNLTMTEGYPSRTTEAGSLLMDHFLRPPKPQTKWYGLHSDQQLDPATVTSWNTGPSKLNNSFGRIARKAALAATPPASRRISQDTLRRWERMAREASVVCNQTASFNRCLFKVQGDMHTQMKVIRGENKGKVSNKLSEAAEELQFFMEFNSSITQAAAKAMEHLTDFVFITMGNLTLARRDSYLSHLKNGVKPDTFAALRTGPLHITTLFSESVVKKAEEEIALYDNKSHPMATTSCIKNRYHPYERADRKQEGRSEGKQDRPAWKNINRHQVNLKLLIPTCPESAAIQMTVIV